MCQSEYALLLYICYNYVDHVFQPSTLSEGNYKLFIFIYYYYPVLLGITKEILFSYTCLLLLNKID